MRAVCEVFGLDAAAAEEVALMRRNLLALVNCRPFSAAAAFKVHRGISVRACVQPLGGLLSVSSLATFLLGHHRLCWSWLSKA